VVEGVRDATGDDHHRAGFRREDPFAALHLESPLQDVINLIVSGVNVERDTLPRCESLLEGAIRTSRPGARDATEQAVPNVAAFAGADDHRIHHVSCFSLWSEEAPRLAGGASHTCCPTSVPQRVFPRSPGPAGDFTRAPLIPSLGRNTG